MALFSTAIFPNTGSLLFYQKQQDYQKLDPTVTRRVNEAITTLEQDPLRYPQALPLKGDRAGAYRWRVGDWRIIYQVDQTEPTVYILQILHRRRAYRS